MIMEHEAFHAEVCRSLLFFQCLTEKQLPQTLLYTSLQFDGAATISPPGFVPPVWDILIKTWNSIPELPSSSVVLGPATITLSHNDTDDGDDTNNHSCGWDSAHPKRQVAVVQFRIDWRPVTNGEFYLFYVEEGKNKTHFPASWVEIQNGFQVRGKHRWWHKLIFAPLIEL